MPFQKRKEQWEIDIDEGITNLSDEDEDDIIPKENNEVKYFPIKEVSISHFRKQEQRFLKQKFEYSTYKSFNELFTERTSSLKTESIYKN